MSAAAAARNSSSYRLIGMVKLLYRYRTSSSSSSPSPGCTLHANKFGYGGYVNLGPGGFIIRSFTAAGSRSSSTRPEADTRKSHFYTKVTDVQPSPPVVPPPKPGISSWAKWLLGFVLSILIPWKQKWESLRQLEGKVEKVVGEVEEVAEVVEKAAAVAENVSAKVADQFPNNSRIKEAAVAVEHISNVAVADAQLAQNFIHKVEDVKKDLKDLETMVEPLIDN